VTRPIPTPQAGCPERKTGHTWLRAPGKKDGAMTTLPNAAAGRSSPSVPEPKYHKSRVYTQGRMCPVVVWDGVHGYENIPPPALLIAENLMGRIGIAQIRNRKAGIDTILALLKETDSVIIWARDHATYRSIVTNIERQSHGRLQ
jgi:hypothetical protein